MKTLCRDLLTHLNIEPRVPSAVAVLQFGEGNFLRAFVDMMLDTLNETLHMNLGVCVAQPIERGMTDALAAQDGLYTVLLRGREEGGDVCRARVVQCVNRCVNPYEDFEALLSVAREPSLRYIVSNTTEAGIVYTGLDRKEDAPPASYPGKLTRVLFERFSSGLSGVYILPCELIDDNARHLKDAVYSIARDWALPDAFLDWLSDQCAFCSTLVDRIVTGFPRGEQEALWQTLGYRDDLLDVAEPFGLWVIQSPLALRGELPLDKAGCPVVFTDDVKPYKVRKVRMLNGAHTSMVCAGYLCGLDTVGECMNDQDVRAFLEKALYREIMPVVPLPEDDVRAFASAILQRFENPFNKHALLSIALNSVSKYAARVLPSLEDSVNKTGVVPECLCFGLAALIMLYAGARPVKDGYEGVRDGKSFPIKDDEHVLRTFSRLACDMPSDALAYAVLADQSLWNRDLREIPGLEDTLARQIGDIQRLGMRAALAEAAR